MLESDLHKNEDEAFPPQTPRKSWLHYSPLVFKPRSGLGGEKGRSLKNRNKDVSIPEQKKTKMFQHSKLTKIMLSFKN